MDKVSPHFAKISASLNALENANKKVQPSILVGDELQRFDGLIKKIQNHREIVRNFEIKREETVSGVGLSTSEER